MTLGRAASSSDRSIPATSAILVESIATAIAATLGAALLGRAVAGGGGTAVAVAVLAVAVLAAVATAWSARRVGPVHRDCVAAGMLV